MTATRLVGLDLERLSATTRCPGCHDTGRFAERCQNRVQERSPDAAGEAGGSTGNNFGAAFGEPIAFFTASQIISREKGFSRKVDILSFSALKATAAGS
jgi:hypothetical protein